MRRFLPLPIHDFHIPVMGTGFTMSTPARVARYGIASVVSIVDDMLVEQTRHRIAKQFGKKASPISRFSEEHRARRITAYLNMLDEIVEEQIAAMKTSAFEVGSEITHYFEMLPTSPLKALYERMKGMHDGPEKDEAQAELREQIRPGAIDVNIMTKLDRDHTTGKIQSGSFGSDALAALRGFAQSKLSSSVVLSAGLNLRLFTHIGEFEDFFPDAAGRLRKGIILKVGDLRSAAIQGRVLAKRGLWVSEFRIESGLNCGGHAFGEKGLVLGPILEEFRRGRDSLFDQLHSLTNKALTAAGRPQFEERPPARVTVQGGIGNATEDRMLREVYGVDGTGWASPFLLCPDVVSIDDEHVNKLIDAGVDDVELSKGSPLGVPFWNLRNSASEAERQGRIDDGKPGIKCTKGFLVSNFEYSDKGICTASRVYQKRKLEEVEQSGASPEDLADQTEKILAKACLCRNLGGGVAPDDEKGEKVATAICCGPNTVYFNAVATLREMVEHIYGRTPLHSISKDRPHVFIKELGLHIQHLRELAQERGEGLMNGPSEAWLESRTNLLSAIEHYREMAGRIASGSVHEFHAALDAVHAELEQLMPQPALEQ